MSTPTASSVAPAAQPISLGQLQQELGGGNKAAPEKQIFKESKNETVRLGDDKGNVMTESPLPGFRAQAEALMAKKLEEPEEVVAKKEPEAKRAESVKAEPVAKKEEKAAPAAKDDDVPEDQLRVLPHDKPDTAKRIKKLASEVKVRDEKITAHELKIKELESRPSSAANDEAIKAAQERLAKAEDELVRFRRRYDIDNDPEFATKYREPVKLAEKTIEDTLKRGGAGDGVLETIRKEGGFAAFSRSNKQFTINEVDPATGETRPVNRTAGELARAWLSGMPIADSEAVRTAIGDQERSRRDETLAIQKAQDEAKTYFETQSKQTAEQQRAAQEATARTAKEYEDWAAKTESETEWMRPKDVPENATAEQKKAIESENEFNAQLRARLKKHPKTAAEYGTLMLEAAESHHLRRTLGDKDSEIAALREQLSKAKGAMKTTVKQGSLLHGSNQKAPEEKAPADPTDFRSLMRKKAQAMSSSADE